MKQIWLMWLFVRLVRKEAKRGESAGSRVNHLRTVYDHRWWRRHRDTTWKWQAFHRACLDAINNGYLEEKEIEWGNRWKINKLFLTTKGRSFVELDGLAETILRERGKLFSLLLGIITGGLGVGLWHIWERLVHLH